LALIGQLKRAFAEDARDMAFLMPDSDLKTEAFLRIGEALVEKGEPARSALLQALSKDNGSMLMVLAPLLARVGEFSRIPPLIVKLENPDWRRQVATGTARALARSNHFKEAMDLAKALSASAVPVPFLTCLPVVASKVA
jgi:hypothetical protein